MIQTGQDSKDSIEINSGLGDDRLPDFPVF